MNTAVPVATIPGIMNEWLSTYLPIFVVPERSKLIAAMSEPYVGMKSLRAYCSNLGLIRFWNENTSSHFFCVSSFFSFSTIWCRLLPVL